MKMDFVFIFGNTPAAAARDPSASIQAGGTELVADGSSTNARLCDLDLGDEAVVVSIDEHGPAGRRLLDLGLLPGTRVRALGRAPLGDPSIFELRGYQLCLRNTESSRVRVRDTAPGLSESPAGSPARTPTGS